VLEQQRQALEQRLTDLEQLAQQQARQDALTSDVTQFCENITSVLQSPTPQEKQQVLRLVVDHILVGKEQLTIKHIIPLIGDSRLCTQRYGSNPYCWGKVSDQTSDCLAPHRDQAVFLPTTSLYSPNMVEYEASLSQAGGEENASRPSCLHN
jgi:hypothetical protein